MATKTLTLELGDEAQPERCPCCGKKSRTVHGFVYKDGDAYAIYYAGWSDGHPERGITMAIATGDWGDESDVSDRVSIGFEARADDSQIHFTVLDPEQSPWGHTNLFGDMVPRESALQHPQLKDYFKLAELVVQQDSRVKKFTDKVPQG